MTGHPPPKAAISYPQRLHHCQRCGKWCYPSRTAAKAAARMLHPGDHMSAYWCPVDGRYAHFGHLPAAVITGEIERAEIGSTRKIREGGAA